MDASGGIHTYMYPFLIGSVQSVCNFKKRLLVCVFSWNQICCLAVVTSPDLLTSRPHHSHMTWCSTEVLFISRISTSWRVSWFPALFSFVPSQTLWLCYNTHWATDPYQCSIPKQEWLHILPMRLGRDIRVAMWMEFKINLVNVASLFPEWLAEIRAIQSEGLSLSQTLVPPYSLRSVGYACQGHASLLTYTKVLIALTFGDLWI